MRLFKVLQLRQPASKFRQLRGRQMKGQVRKSHHHQKVRFNRKKQQRSKIEHLLICWKQLSKKIKQVLNQQRMKQSNYCYLGSNSAKNSGNQSEYAGNNPSQAKRGSNPELERETIEATSHESTDKPPVLPTKQACSAKGKEISFDDIRGINELLECPSAQVRRHCS